ncbi:MAG: hypothetical protein HY208_04565 [Nitrospirae bacterium]|nr:hypothetical protein [Nitrospirota bacterium]
MNRWVKRLLAVILVLAAVIVAVGFMLGAMVKAGVETIGPKLTGATVSVDSIMLLPLTGHGTITGLIIGNPKGFHSERAFKLDRVRVRLRVASLFSDTVLIDEITVIGPEITYEQGFSGSNISALRDHIESASRSDKGGRKTGAAAGPSGKQVQIGDVLIKDGTVKLSAALLKGEAVAVRLPDIHLKDLGKQPGGATVSEVSAEIFRAINGAVVKAVSSSGTVGKEGVRKLGESAGEAGSAALKSIKGLLGK